MRFIDNCWECYGEMIKVMSDGHQFTRSLIEGEVNSDFIVEYNCNKGHQYLTYYSLEHFDLLYLAGLDSFVKGCYSESVMSFTVSLERMYEFFIKIILFNKFKDLNRIDSYWKNLKNLSERQFGAFCTLYFNETGNTWTINNNMISFRNSVIHKGKISSKEETTKYAEYVTDLLSNLVVFLRTNYLDSINTLSEHRLSEIRIKGENMAIERSLKLKKGEIRSPLNWSYSIPTHITFDEALEMHQLFDYFGLKKSKQEVIILRKPNKKT